MAELSIKIKGDGSQVDKTLQKTASEVAKLEYQTKQAQKQFNTLNKNAANLKGGFGDLAKGIKGCDFGSISNGITAIGGNISSVLPQLSTLATSIVNPFTLAATAIGAAGKAFYDYNVELDRSLQRTQQFTGLSGNELMSLRNGIKSVADTFNTDYNTVLSSVDGLMSQFGISGEEALRIIRDGFVGGANDGNKMLDLISKYSGAFNDAGISASELVAIIGNTRSGIFDENGMELFSKASTKIREFSDSLKESLNAVGINAEDMYNKLQSGEMSTVQAIKEISSKLKELSPQSQEVGNVLSDVFGKQGAKSGYQLVTALADVETDLSKVKEQTGEWGSAMEQLQQADRELENALSSLFGGANEGFSTITTKLKSEVYGAIAKVINGFIDTYNNSLMLRARVQAIALQFKNGWEIIKGILKIFGHSLAALGEEIEGIFTLDWEKVKSGWKNGVSNILKDVATGFENVKENYDHAKDEILNGKIEKIEIPVETTYTENSNKISGTKTNTPKNTKEKKSKTKTETKKTETVIETGSLKDYQNQLQKLNDELNNTNVSEDRLKEILSEKAAIESQIAALKERNGLLSTKQPATVIPDGSLKSIQSKLSDLKAKFELSVDGSEEFFALASEIAKLTEKEHTLKLRMDEASMTDAQKGQQEFNKIQEDFNKQCEEANEHSQQLQEAFGNVASVFSSLGGAIGGEAGAAIEKVGEMINAFSSIMGIIQQYQAIQQAAHQQELMQTQQKIVAKEGESLANVTASASQAPWFMTLALIAAGVAAVTAIFSSIGSFASGGIIGGATTIGDYNLARVNAGEMILNGRQQANLFRMLNGSGANNGSLGGNVTFTIKGDKLQGVLNNYNNRLNKTR